MHDAVFFISLVWLAVLLAAGVVAVARAATTTGRILALDLMALLLIAILALVAGREDRAAFLDPALALTAAFLLAGVLATAGAAKLRDPVAFAGAVANYRLLPPALVAPFALALPPAELATALGLLVPASRPAAAWAAGFLLLLFAAAMAVNLLRGRRDVDCGCHGGLLRQRIAWPLVWRNLALAAGAAALALAGTHPRPLTALDWVTVAAATASLGLLHAALGRLFGLAPVALHGAR